MSAPTTDDDYYRDINRVMTQRLTEAPPQPIAEGGYALRVLAATGRRTGIERTTPVGLLQLDGALHLVSPDCRRDWVRNLLAEPRCRLLAGEKSTSFVADPLRGAAGAAVVHCYLGAVDTPWALRAFPVLATAPISDIESTLDLMAVFLLLPVAIG